MLSVVHENDQRSREILSAMLRELGFARVHATAHLEESLYFLDKEQEQIDLIISGFSEELGFDFPLSRAVLKTQNLDHCPLIVLTENWRDRSYSPFQRRMSRVDGVLPRPFGLASLEESVARAFENRARFRNTLVFYGNKASATQVEDEIFSNPKMQWKKVVSFTDPKEMIKFLFTHERRLGGVILETDSAIACVADDLRRFKRTRQGANVPFSSYGQDAALLAPLITFIDVSFVVGTELNDVLSVISKRSIHSWSVSNSVRAIRAAMKKKDFKSAKQMIKQAKDLDSDRWEILELDGHVNGNAESLRKALETQPGSPFAYLSLLPLVDDVEKRQLIDQSALFCPRHPELLAMRS